MYKIISITSAVATLSIALYFLNTAPSNAATVYGDLARITSSCDQASQGLYAMEEGESRTVPICSLNGAFFWKADMDIDCDGESSAHCNETTDPSFQPRTTYQTSEGEYPQAEFLPFAVIPTPNSTFDYKAVGIHPGALVAMLYGGKIVYGPLVDENAEHIIGEASYAAARALGINPDPRNGGVEGPEITYIAFTGSDAVVNPLESISAANSLGESLVSKLITSDIGATSTACSFYQRGMAVPSSYAPPYGVVGDIDDLFFTTSCNASNFSVKIGSSHVTNNNFTVYDRGYRWNGSSWSSFTLVSDGGTKDGRYILGSAKSSGPLSYARDSAMTYVVTFSCTAQGRTWKCGCRDSSCAEPHWQLQAAARP